MNINLAPLSTNDNSELHSSVRHLRFASQFEEENGIASEIETLGESEQLSWEDFVVLTRTRAECLRIQQRLLQVRAGGEQC